MCYARQVLISLLLLLTPGFVLSADPPLQASLTPFKPRLAAPNMALKSMDGQAIDLAKLRGKVVIVNFWATWCPPCRREFPSMERLRLKLAGKPLEILAVNEGENVETIELFTSQLEEVPHFPILLDAEGDAMALWPVRGLPTTFILDKRGRMAYRAIGGREFDHSEIVETISRLMREN